MTYPITTNLVAISPLSCFSPGTIIIWEENAPNGCWDNCVTSTFDLTNEIDLGFSRSIFSCDQAALQMVQSFCLSVCLSVPLSVRPSVCHTSFTMFPSSYHHEISRSYYQWQKWCPCKRCKRSGSEVKGQGHRGQNPTCAIPDCNSSLNSPMTMKWCRKLEVA